MTTRLTALSTAFLQSGLFVLIPKNVKLDAPLQLTFVGTSNEQNNANFPRVLLVAEENSSATVIENYAGCCGESYFTNSVTEVVLNDGARLDHYRLQRESDRSLSCGNNSC